MRHMRERQSIEVMKTATRTIGRILLIFGLVLAHPRFGGGQSSAEVASGPPPAGRLELSAAPDSSARVKSSPPPRSEEEFAQLSKVVDELQKRGYASDRDRALLILMQAVLTPAAFAAGVLFANHRQARRMRHQLRLMLERGVAIPGELLAAPERPKPSDLRKGVLLTALGTGIMVPLGVVLPPGAWSLGLIFVFMGAAYLALWRVDLRHRNP